LNRNDFQKISSLRIGEARLLYENKRYEGAYYLAGYSVECALKACIAKQTLLHDFPEKEKVVASYTHKLDPLLRLAGLENAMHAAASQVRLNWAIVKDWSEQKRYDLSISQQEAKDLLSACTARRYGILPWLKTEW
jgi:hypothetical protein